MRRGKIMAITELPAYVLSFDEQERIAEHYKNKLWIGVAHGEKPRKYSPTERTEIGSLYDSVRANGFMVTGVDRFGRLTYSKVVKSAVQKMLEEGLLAA